MFCENVQAFIGTWKSYTKMSKNDVSDSCPCPISLAHVEKMVFKRNNKHAHIHSQLIYLSATFLWLDECGCFTCDDFGVEI